MRFFLRYDKPARRGRLLYVRQDHAIDFTPDGPRRDSSGSLGSVTLGIDTLQLEADVETGWLLGIWGYFGREGWKNARLTVPVAKEGAVVVEFERAIESGSSYTLGKASDWDAIFDASMGWVVARTASTQPAEHVEFLQGVVAGLADEQLVEIWMRPEFVDSYPENAGRETTGAE